MRYLNKKDQEIYNAIRLFVKLDKGEEVIQSLLAASNNTEEDADYWFYKALHTCEMLRKIGSQMEIFDCYEEILDSCENAIAINPQHWPAYYLRSLFSILIQREIENEDETIHYLLPCFRSPEELVEEADAMIEVQKEETPQPFFITPYCIQALISLDQGKKEEAIDWFRLGLSVAKEDPVTYLPALLQIPFLLLYKEAKLMDLEILNELENCFSKLFLVNIEKVKIS